MEILRGVTGGLITSLFAPVSNFWGGFRNSIDYVQFRGGDSLGPFYKELGDIGFLKYLHPTKSLTRNPITDEEKFTAAGRIEYGISFVPVLVSLPFYYAGRLIGIPARKFVHPKPNHDMRQYRT